MSPGLPHSLAATTPPPVALTIAGFDPSSGAGITADLQVFAAFGLFGTSCITACTAQSTLGVTSVYPLPGAWLRQTLDTLTADLPPAGIKIGMLGSAEALSAVAQFLAQLRRASNVPVVLDPVLRSSSGRELLEPRATELLRRELLPLCDTITPNRRELAVLLGQTDIPLDLEQAARLLQSEVGGREVVITGGDEARPDDLVLTPDGEASWLRGEHIQSHATHGTGCAFSSALLARKIAGDPLPVAAATAKAFVEQAIRSAPGLGGGKGPLNLLWPRRLLDAPAR